VIPLISNKSREGVSEDGRKGYSNLDLPGDHQHRVGWIHGPLLAAQTSIHHQAFGNEKRILKNVFVNANLLLPWRNRNSSCLKLLSSIGVRAKQPGERAALTLTRLSEAVSLKGSNTTHSR
jgi:hypothetical protein